MCSRKQSYQRKKSFVLYFFFLFLFISSVLHISHVQLQAALVDWPGDVGIDVSHDVSSSYEPSGIVWHPRLGQLLMVGDDGDITQMTENGNIISAWKPSNFDLEGVTIADEQTNFIYLGVENPDSILEFNISTGALTGRSWDLTAWMKSSNSNQGLEALAFVPNADHPYSASSSGGLFYAGLQADGKIYIFDVNLSQSGNVSHIATLTPPLGYTDISDLYYHKETKRLYALFDSINRIVEMATDGTILVEYILPGNEQEGITLAPSCVNQTTSIYIAEDTPRRIMRYNQYPVTCVSTLTLTRGPFLQLGKTTEATVVWHTNISGTSIVEYGTSVNLGLTTSGASGTNHCVTLTDLLADTTYFYRIKTLGTLLKVNALDTLYQFKTHQTLNSTGSFSFAVIGDWGNGSLREIAVKNQIKNLQPHFILTVGDNAYQDGTSSEIQTNVFDVYKDVFHSAFFYPAHGNHDHHSLNAGPSRDAYYLFSNNMGSDAEELYYSFDNGDIHFIALDSSKSYLSNTLWEAQKIWLEQDLAATQRPWKIVYFHHPPYSSNTSGHYYEEYMRTEIVPILEKYNVDVVLQGHNHLYEQFYPILNNSRNDAQGLKYYTCGMSGGNLYSLVGPPDPLSLERNTQIGGFLKCHYNATTKTLTIEPIDENGNSMGTTWTKIKLDPDHDGLTYAQEDQWGTNPLDSDTDDDGLNDGEEVSIGTNPNVVDTDGDGMNDFYEVIAGTHPLSASSVSVYLFKDNFDDANMTGWSISGASTANWNVSTGALVAAPSASGYSFIAPSSLNISSVSSFAISYDVTFSTASDGWGGLLIMGRHCDVNVNRCGWRDGSWEGLSGSYQWYPGMTKGVKHHVLLLVKKASPFYLTDLYIDAKPVFINQPIETTSFPTNSVGLVSNYQIGTVTYDDFIVYPNPAPLFLPFSDNFNASDYGAWIVSGNTQLTWDFVNGALRSYVSSAVSGTGYAYLKQALLDISGKDVVIEMDMIPQPWGGFMYRGVACDMNQTRIGWRDGSWEGQSGTYQWYGGLSAGTSHHIILIIQRSTPYALSRLYVDGTLIFSNEPIQVSSYPDKTIGFLSNYFTGSKLYDNISVTAADSGTNFAPILDSIGNQKVIVGSTLFFQAKAFDPNGDAIIYSAVNLPVGASMSSTTGAFSWAPPSTDAGTYSITLSASDGSLSDSETITVSVVAPSTNPGLIAQESFDSGLSGWVETGATHNVDWTVTGNMLQSKVMGTGGYSYLDNTNINLSGNTHIAIEYDVTFTNSDGWGGFRYRNISCDINPNRCGWRDGSYESLSGTYRWFPGLTRNTTHHVILFIQSRSPYYTSDLYVDGKPIFTNEPIEVLSFSSNTMGFLSPYDNHGGFYSVDNLIVKDMTQLAPSGAVSASFDFSSNLNRWIMAGNVANINWSNTSQALVSTVVGQGGYSFFFPYDIYVSERNMILDYDVTFSSTSDGWGGFLYRGIHIDVNPNRYGVRDGSYEGLTGSYRWYTSHLTRGVNHHVRAAFRPSSPYVLMDLAIDGSTVFTHEPIETHAFLGDSIGFASNFYEGTVTHDNLTLSE